MLTWWSRRLPPTTKRIWSKRLPLCPLLSSLSLLNLSALLIGDLSTDVSTPLRQLFKWAHTILPHGTHRRKGGTCPRRSSTQTMMRSHLSHHSMSCKFHIFFYLLFLVWICALRTMLNSSLGGWNRRKLYLHLGHVYFSQNCIFRWKFCMIARIEDLFEKFWLWFGWL
jgi:hypothetical protein